MSHSKKRRQQPHYPVEVKEMALARVRAGERVSSVAAALGCRPNRIYYWLKNGPQPGEWAERPGRWRGREAPVRGSPQREAELERLLGQQQAELDFLREALRLMKQARRPTAEPDVPSPTSSSRAGRLSRKAD